MEVKLDPVARGRDSPRPKSPAFAENVGKGKKVELDKDIAEQAVYEVWLWWGRGSLCVVTEMPGIPLASRRSE